MAGHKVSSEAAAEAQDSPDSLLLTLPPEVLVDGIIPLLSSREIKRLSRTCKLFHALCKDPAVWRIKMQSDFSLVARQLAIGSGADDAGWYERVYLGLKKPRTYLWGSADQARLGNMQDMAARTRAARLSYVRMVTKPMDVSDWFSGDAEGVDEDEDSGSDSDLDAPQLARVSTTATAGEASGSGPEPRRAPKPEKSKHTSIVDLQASGWSFAARDSRGGVWAWGKLDGTTWANNDDWSHEGAIVEDATRIPLPCKATQIATGRQHLIVLDADNLIWEMRAWGRAYHHTARELTAPTHSGAGTATRGPHIIQIEAGWEFSACLTAAGDIHTWKPFSSEYTRSLTPEDQLSGPLGTEQDRQLRWGKVGPEVIFTLPAIPERPEPPSHDKILVKAEEAFVRADSEQGYASMSSSRAADRKKERERVVKIAATKENVLALKANGEVWSGSTHGQWEYLAHFSSPAITHISAQWTNFFTYATSTPTNPSSAVLSGRGEAFLPGSGWNLTPKRLAGLDKLRVISIVAGDWHFAALTADGDMYTWGQNDWGQCGVSNDGSKVTTPRKVVFPPDGKRPAFVFAITAAGHHSGALVLGHPRGKNELPPIKRPKHKPARGGDGEHGDEGEGSEQTQNVPLFSMPRFRIGFAGRGMRRNPGRTARPG